MRPLFLATALLAALVGTQAAIACTTMGQVSSSLPEHVIKPGDCIWSSNARYVLNMQDDGVLSLYDEQHPGHFLLWTDTSAPAPKGSSAILRNDGSFVVADASGKEVWRAPVQLPAGTPADYHGDFFLMLGKKGRVEIYKGSGIADPAKVMVWASALPPEADINGECQCHITNTDHSPGQKTGNSFGTCGVTACFQICQSRKDYFGDALSGTYKNGTGKCKAF